MKFVKRFRKSREPEKMTVKSIYREWNEQRAIVQNFGQSSVAEVDAIFTRALGEFEQKQLNETSK